MRAIDVARRRRSDEDAALGCLVYTGLIIFLMPIAGIYFLCKPSPNAKVGGAVLLIVGLFLWAFIAFNS